jgi:heptosyltransferase-1
MAERTGKRILIVRLSAIGDVVVTTPVTRALRRALPDAHLAWLVEPLARPMVEHNPFLDEVIAWERPRGGLRPTHLLELRRRLAPRRFDYAVDCQGLWRSALAARFSGARRVVGNRVNKEPVAPLYHDRVERRPGDPSSRQRCLDLLAPLGVVSTDRSMVLEPGEAARARAGVLLREAGVAGDEPYACLVAGTTWPQKHWFDESWAALATLLWRRHGLRSLLLGGPGDVERAGRIAAGAQGPVVSLAGRTSLQEAVAVLQGALGVVAVDTGLLHAAVAVGTPTVGVCGASGWPGFQDYERFRLVREPLPCSPCYHRPTCGGRFDCMRAVTAERVLAALETLLDAPVAAPREPVAV